MRYQDILFGIALAVLMGFICADAKTVFRRADKLSQTFQRLDLTPEEIDPNVAPSGLDQTTQLIDESIVDHTDESPAVATNEIADEAPANEVVDEATPAAVSSSSPSNATFTEATTAHNQNDVQGLGKYCKCAEDHCDCCRQFNLPIIPVRGPGCAKITYLGNERMSVSIKYGDITLATRTISGKRAKPICVGLPGGYSKFCGRVYGLSRAKNDFKACLGFELRAEDEVEAALRVSCFKFGPEGLRVAEAEPLPTEVNKDEDDDDIFGFGAGGDDDDDDYDDEQEEADEEDEEADEEAEENDDEAPADADYGGFSLVGLLEELGDDDDDNEKPVSSAPTTDASAVVPVAASRVAVDRKDTALQSKEAGTDFHSTTAIASDAFSTDAVTPESASLDATTTISKKKTKRVSKQKKKKSASATENDFAIEILNGILDFFN